MTIDEAIEMLNHLSCPQSRWLVPHHKGAVKLGIEALKREKYNRLHQPNLIFGKLPGETEE